MDDLKQKAAEMFVEGIQDSGVYARRETIDGQVKALKSMSDILHDISRIPGGVGITFFHNALGMAETLDCAIGNLCRAEQLCKNLQELQARVSA